MSDPNIEFYNTPAVNGDVGLLAIAMARLASNLYVTLEKVEQKTGIDLAEQRKELRGVNEEAFGLFKALTGWTGSGWASSLDR